MKRDKTITEKFSENKKNRGLKKNRRAGQQPPFVFGFGTVPTGLKSLLLLGFSRKEAKRMLKSIPFCYHYQNYYYQNFDFVTGILKTCKYTLIKLHK